ncbi:MAG TPA: phosphoribosylformylglycinamidine synthase subunit PurQ [Planctomycetaceae bacterium]|jgi:phosphoribosylformylglycinamidine synthase I|nr:phosphoribosylformylglycinamidine synthase subunit PurQ [Planctomycetaceae bacterium]
MASPRVCVLRAPGTNCDVETAFAFETAGGQPERVHLFRLLERPELLDDFQIVCVPGGFSYGDDIGAGVIFSRQLRGRLGESLARFLAADKLILGICNGFQVLLKAGILPGGAGASPKASAPQQSGQQPASNEQSPDATLTWNLNGKYTAVWVKLQVESSKNVFLRGIKEIELPVAHAEGRIVVRSPDVIQTWRERSQIALSYRPIPHEEGPVSGSDGDSLLPFPDNPNGSIANIAGLGDPTGRILGLMPHPERFLHSTQHPRWTRRPHRSGPGEGLKLFHNAVAYFG